jgi:NAD(P)H-dependent flavin oxidoreductase YrpB (nitropropane dioxygenase family)
MIDPLWLLLIKAIALSRQMLMSRHSLFNGQSLAAALMLGASAAWVGTRFVLSEEAGAPKAHQEAVRTAGFDDDVRTIIFTGRPLRVRNNEYIKNWEENRQAEIKELTDKGIIPVESDFEKMGDEITDEVRPKCLLAMLRVRTS